MPRPPLPLPAALGEVFTAAHARAAGVGSRRLSQPDVERIARGVYRRVGAGRALPPGGAVAAETWRMMQRENAAALMRFLPEGAFFSHYTAAAIWHLPVPERPCARHGLDVAVHLPRHAVKRGGVIGHRVQASYAQTVQRNALSVTDPASTWALLAALLVRDDAVALGDAAIRQNRIPGTRRLERPPLAGIADLSAAANAAGRSGGPRLRSLVQLLSPHSASPPESHLRLRLTEWGVPQFELDFDVLDEQGHLVGCSEFAFVEFGLALEYEGRHHLTDARQWNRDIEKYRRYAQLGWEVIRVTAELLYRRPHELRAQIFEALRRRGWTG